MTNDMRVMGLALGLTMTILGLGIPDARAQRAATGPPDWPCVQRLVPELAWGTIWTGPSPEALERTWWEDEEVGHVVRFATARETPRDEALERVRDFVAQVASQPEAEREERLTLLFAGLFERVNRERSRVIERIRSASRGQVKRLDRLAELVDELEARRASSEANGGDIEQLRQELHWEQRTFQKRQQLLPVLCEKPSLLEEELSRMVRAIRAEL
ncbi:hypothetical protein QLQ86_08295 [Halomonas sp. LR5S13]|uniref:hypothetical protein n=1 Tax=Halomonas rhizosphaerae TaxID=3043296 RepID=UPI0024A80123|nr:hypothetical protein [Halomonas rhizosphaerae]MDI5920784.1 hypothetical protein [Halomonas rhizosphaerae]